MLRKIGRKIAGAIVLLQTFFKIIVNALRFRPTYCHLLWENVFISPNGDTFGCCSWKPGKFGNINDDSLAHIWSDSPRLKIYRILSLHNCLNCFLDCHILSKAEKLRPPPRSIDTRHPKKVWLLYGETCNLNCIMCPQEHRSMETLDNEVIQKNIDWDQVEEIEMQGGEILAMENAKTLYLWLTTELNKKVNLITNGLLINDEWAYHLVNGSSWIQISINAATKRTHELVNKNSDFDKVISNVNKLIKLKHLHCFTVNIIYKFTVITENVHEIADAILAAEEFGFDEIHFGHDAIVIDYLAKNHELRKKLRTQILQCTKSNYKVTIERNRLEHLGLLD